MGINVAGCADVAMAQVVETDALHLVRYEEVRKMLAQKVGANPLAYRVHIDIVEIIRTIVLATNLPIQLLLFHHLPKHLLTGRDQRKVRQLDFVLVLSRATSVTTPSTFVETTVCWILIFLFSKSMASHFRPTISLRRSP